MQPQLGSPHWDTACIFQVFPSSSLQTPYPPDPPLPPKCCPPMLASQSSCGECWWEPSQALATARGQKSAPLQPHCFNPYGCHQERVGVPASRCSSGQPRAGAGGIFLVCVSSRAHRQALYLKLWQTIVRGCLLLHDVSTLQSPSHRYYLLPSFCGGLKRNKV